MVWYSLTIGEYSGKMTPMSVKSPRYPKCDKEGKKLKGKYGKSKLVYKDTGKEYTGKVYREIEGKILENPKYPRTERVLSSDVELVPLDLAQDILVEKMMFVECDELNDRITELQQDNKTMLIDGFVLREGLTTYIGYLDVDRSGYLYLKLGKGLISDVIDRIINNKPLPEANSNKTYIKRKSLLKDKFKKVVRAKTEADRKQEKATAKH